MAVDSCPRGASDMSESPGGAYFSDVDAVGAADRAATYLATAAERVAQTRKESYHLLAVGAGDSVLDVGCGLGEVCADLADLVGHTGTVVGVDLSQALIERARQQWEALPIRFEVGDAENLQFEDATFHAVWSERVLQHVARPAVAIAEIARVLRPGGRLLVTDSVHRSFVVATANPRVWDAIRAHGAEAVRNPDVGLRLGEWMESAGLQVQVHPIARIAGDWPTVRLLLGIDAGAAAAVEAGAITAVEAEDFLAEQQARFDRGVFAMSTVVVRALGTKPV